MLLAKTGHFSPSPDVVYWESMLEQARQRHCISNDLPPTFSHASIHHYRFPQIWFFPWNKQRRFNYSRVGAVNFCRTPPLPSRVRPLGEGLVGGALAASKRRHAQGYGREPIGSKKYRTGVVFEYSSLRSFVVIMWPFLFVTGCCLSILQFVYTIAVFLVE